MDLGRHTQQIISGLRTIVEQDVPSVVRVFRHSFLSFPLRRARGKEYGICYCSLRACAFGAVLELRNYVQARLGAFTETRGPGGA